MARIESSQALVGKTVTRANGTQAKIVSLLVGGYKMSEGPKLSARNLTKQGGKFVEIQKTDIRLLTDLGGYVKVAAEPAKPDSPKPDTKPSNSSASKMPSARQVAAALSSAFPGLAVSVTPTAGGLDIRMERAAEVNTDTQAGAASDVYEIKTRTVAWLQNRTDVDPEPKKYNYYLHHGKAVTALRAYAKPVDPELLNRLAQRKAKTAEGKVYGIVLIDLTQKPTPKQATVEGPLYDLEHTQKADAASKLLRVKGVRATIARALGLTSADVKPGLVFLHTGKNLEYVLDASSNGEALILRRLDDAKRFLFLEAQLGKGELIAKGVDDRSLD